MKPRVVLVSCALLMVLSAPGYGSSTACENAAKQLRELRNAIEHYQMTRGHYPEQHRWYRTLIAAGEIADRKNEDPWGHPYVYESKGGSYDLLTVGYDGIRGTKDDQVMADGWRWSSCMSNTSWSARAWSCIRRI